ncbi:MAG: NAD(P)-binding protein, partial [FCB group bacterium]|nr:NAD(P)-binding protein [FCB group bacterium]
RGLAAPEDSLIAWEPELCVGCLRCVRACAELKGVGAMGFVRRGDEVIVGLVGPDRKAAGCRWCGACVEVCPTGALTDRGVSVVERESRLVPCRSGCPAGVDVPRFLRAVADGRTDDAARVMLDRLPLPHALGRVCYHPCERTCRRSEIGGALAVCRLRRLVFQSDVDGVPAWPEGPAVEGRVAVVGGGPAGLAAAHFLRRLGREVTVFEAAPEAGGMLRY